MQKLFTWCKTHIWKIGVGLLLLFTLLYATVSYILYNQLTDISGGCQRTDNLPTNFDADWSSWADIQFDFSPYWMPSYELVHFPSRDPQFNIAGWYIENDPNAPVVIVVHGINSCKRDHVVLTHAGMLWHHGFNILLVDVRDAGDSDYEDGRSAIGTEEYLDVLGGWDWLQSKKGFTPPEIGLVGNSLGAATALIAFAEEPQIAALFVDSPIDNLPQIIQEELERNSYPLFLYHGGIWAAKLVANDNLMSHNPYDGIEKAGDRPIFILHGEADKRINIQHSEQLVARAEKLGVNISYWPVPNTDHVQAPATHPEEYEKNISTFFIQHLTSN